MEDGSALNNLFPELKLIMLGYLDARSLHAMMVVNRSFHELIHSANGQIGLWLPLLSRLLYKDLEETLKVYSGSGNEDWKTRFVEALKIPSFDTQANQYFVFADAHTATLSGGEYSGYKCARAIRPIHQSSMYFEGYFPSKSPSPRPKLP